MAIVYEHFSVEELEERYVGCQAATAWRHIQVIWPLARGHTVSQRNDSLRRAMDRTIARPYLRRRNGASATLLKAELMDVLPVTSMTISSSGFGFQANCNRRLRLSGIPDFAAFQNDHLGE